MILGLIAAISGMVTSSVVIESVSAGVGLGISIFTASKCVKQTGRTRKR